MISVIIPTYHRNDLLLGRAIPSVLRQHRKADEIIVIHDGRDDNAIELESHLSRLRDPRIRFLAIARQEYPENKWGLLGVDARNRGLDLARGTWISLLDDDDEMAPDNLSSLFEIVEESDVEFAYRQSMTFKGGRPTGQVYGKWPPGDGSITHGAFLMQSDLGYRYALDCYERGRNADADLWIRMYEGGVKFRFVPGIIHHYHRNYP